MTQPKALSREELLAFCDAVEAILPGRFTPTVVYQRALNRIDEDLGAVRRLLEPAADVEAFIAKRRRTLALNLDGEKDGLSLSDVRALAATLYKQRSRETAEQVMRLASEAELAKQDAASLRAERGWVPVTERLPDHAGEVLVLLDGEAHWFAWFVDGERWVLHRPMVGTVTHWQELLPLPTPPSDGGKEGA